MLVQYIQKTYYLNRSNHIVKRLYIPVNLHIIYFNIRVSLVLLVFFKILLIFFTMFDEIINDCCKFTTCKLSQYSN